MSSEDGRRDLAAICGSYLREHKPETAVRDGDADEAPRGASPGASGGARSDDEAASRAPGDSGRAGGGAAAVAAAAARAAAAAAGADGASRSRSRQSLARTPSRPSSRSTSFAQPRFAAGLAGLGWGMHAISTPSSPSAAFARASAKRPMPITRRGRRIAICFRSESSHAASSGSRSAHGSCAGVRFRPLASRKSSGQ